MDDLGVAEVEAGVSEPSSEAMEMDREVAAMSVSELEVYAVGTTAALRVAALVAVEAGKDQIEDAVSHGRVEVSAATDVVVRDASTRCGVEGLALDDMAMLNMEEAASSPLSVITEVDLPSGVASAMSAEGVAVAPLVAPVVVVEAREDSLWEVVSTGKAAATDNAVEGVNMLQSAEGVALAVAGIVAPLAVGALVAAEADEGQIIEVMRVGRDEISAAAEAVADDARSPWREEGTVQKVRGVPDVKSAVSSPWGVNADVDRARQVQPSPLSTKSVIMELRVETLAAIDADKGRCFGEVRDEISDAVGVRDAGPPREVDGAALDVVSTLGADADVLSVQIAQGESPSEGERGDLAPNAGAPVTSAEGAAMVLRNAVPAAVVANEGKGVDDVTARGSDEVGADVCDAGTSPYLGRAARDVACALEADAGVRSAGDDSPGNAVKINLEVMIARIRLEIGDANGVGDDAELLR